MNFRTDVEISIIFCSEQEGEPNRIILREIVSVRLERERVVKKCDLIVVFRLRRSRKIFNEHGSITQ